MAEFPPTRRGLLVWALCTASVLCSQPAGATPPVSEAVPPPAQESGVEVPWLLVGATAVCALAAGSLSYTAAQTANEMDSEFRGNARWLRLRSTARSQAGVATALWALAAMGAASTGIVLYTRIGERAASDTATRVSLLGLPGGAGLSVRGAWVE